MDLLNFKTSYFKDSLKLLQDSFFDNFKIIIIIIIRITITTICFF